jgi:hypothetical protein
MMVSLFSDDFFFLLKPLPNAGFAIFKGFILKKDLAEKQSPLSLHPASKTG